MKNSETPLENYDPKEYCDPIERTLAEESVLTIQHRPYTAISLRHRSKTALRTLSALDISCLMIEEGGELVGVFFGTRRSSQNRDRHRF